MITVSLFNRFETRLLPTKHLNVFWVGTIFRLGVRAEGFADSYRAQSLFPHFKSAASMEIRPHEEKTTPVEL